VRKGEGHEDGTTWLAYNDPTWLTVRHGAKQGTERIMSAMADMLAAVAQEATGIQAAGAAS